MKTTLAAAGLALFAGTWGCGQRQNDTGTAIMTKVPCTVYITRADTTLMTSQGDTVHKPNASATCLEKMDTIHKP